MFKKYKQFIIDQEGLTMVEYAIGAAILATVALVMFSKLADSISILVDNIISTLDSASSSGAGGA